MEEFFNHFVGNLTSYFSNIIDLIPKVLPAFGVLLAFWFITFRIMRFADKRLKGTTDDGFLNSFRGNRIRCIVTIAGVLLIFKFTGLMGILLISLTGAGITAFIVGFALRNLVENFCSRILLIFRRPFKVGDVIEPMRL